MPLGELAQQCTRMYKYSSKHGRVTNVVHMDVLELQCS